MLKLTRSSKLLALEKVCVSSSNVSCRALVDYPVSISATPLTLYARQNIADTALRPGGGMGLVFSNVA